MSTMMIGELARQTGTKVNTIRFYEEIGLMREAARTSSGRRTYDRSDLNRLRFIRRSRRLGFSTDEIRSLLTLGDQPDRECMAVTAIAQHHLVDVNEKISQLLVLREELSRMAQLCAGGTVSDCRILEALSVPVEAFDASLQHSSGARA